MTPIARAGTYEEELEKLSSDLGNAVEKAKLKTIAMGYMKDLQGKETNLGKLLAEELSVNMVNQNRDVSVVDRANLNRLMDEYKLTEEGLIDPANTKKLKLAGIDAIIFGTIAPFDGTYRVSLKAIATDTAKVVAASRSSITESDSLNALMGLSKRSGSSASIQMPSTSAAKEQPEQSKAQRIYNFGDVEAEIKSAIFLEKSAKVRITYTLTSKSENTNAFTYHVVDRNAPDTDTPRFTYTPPEARARKTNYELEGGASDDKGNEYKIIIPAAARSAPKLPMDEAVAFQVEYQIIDSGADKIQIPDTVSFWFEFFAGISGNLESSRFLFKFSAIDCPIDKIQ